MPNLLPNGLWVRLPPDRGTPAEPLSLHATIPGENTPRAVTQVWCSGPSGVPQLVWSAGPGLPSGASATYNNNGKVTVAWTIPSTPDVDSYEVKRPDGSVVGSVAAGVASLVDNAPRVLSGSYSVRGLLSGSYSAPVYTNSLNLTTAPTSVLASYNSGTNRTTVTWAAPAWGTPTRYDVYRNGSYLGFVAGTTLSYVDTSVYAGQNHTYTVTAKLNDLASGSASDDVAVQARPPQYVHIECPPGEYGHKLYWSYPESGDWWGYDIEQFIYGSWQYVGFINKWSVYHRWTNSETVSARIRAGSDGGYSDWVTVGPHAPCWG